MWPQSIVIGVGDTAVCVGTDDADLIDALAPWVIDEPAELVDYGAQLRPPPVPRGQPRVLANVRHGSNWLASSPDPAPIRDGFLRILGGLAHRPKAGEVCLTGVPLLRGDSVHLAAPDEAAHVSARLLSRDGQRPLLVDSVIVDTERLQVRVAGALVGDGAPVTASLREWRATGLDPAMTRAEVVAALTTRVRSRDVDEAVSGLQSLAELVRRLAPTAVAE